MRGSADPQNTTWAKDQGRFGFRMLSMMGWSEGKGLGANEDGITQNIKIAKRTENVGLGAETGNTSNNWLSNSSAFSSILSRLNSNAPPLATAGEIDAQRSPASAATATAAAAAPSRPVGRRYRYHKLVKAKTISNHTVEDISAILVTRQDSSDNETNEPTNIFDKKNKPTNQVNNHNNNYNNTKSNNENNNKNDDDDDDNNSDNDDDDDDTDDDNDDVETKITQNPNTPSVHNKNVMKADLASNSSSENDDDSNESDEGNSDDDDNNKNKKTQILNNPSLHDKNNNNKADVASASSSDNDDASDDNDDVSDDDDQSNSRGNADGSLSTSKKIQTVETISPKQKRKRKSRSKTEHKKRRKSKRNRQK